MHTFQDNQGRKWDLAINVDAVKRVRDLTEVDLLTAIDGRLLQRLSDDPVMLCDVLFAVCKPQADAAGVSDEQFGQGLAGDAIDAATVALLEELVGFFPQRRRAVLTKAIEKLRKLEGMTLNAAAQALDSDVLERVVQQELADTDLETELRARLAEAKAEALTTAGEPSTSSPAPPASTPGR